MKLYVVFLSALMCVVSAMYSQSIPHSEQYKLAWSDNFCGTTLDQAKWTYRTGKRLLSTQLPENVRVQNGNLVIALLGGTDHTYTAGGVISRRTFHYGYFEARIKIVAGSGWHSSFWMMRDAAPGFGPDSATIELDALENYSKDLHSYTVNVHRWAPPHMASGSIPIKTGDLSRDFHVIGCDYAPNVIRYYLDGKLVNTVRWKGEPQGDVNVWLTSVAEGMGPRHDVDDNALPGKMIVDWVRVYTK